MRGKEKLGCGVYLLPASSLPKSHIISALSLSSCWYYRGLRKTPAEPHGLPANWGRSHGNVYTWKCWFPRQFLEKQNKGTTFIFCPKLERGSENVTSIPGVERSLPPLLSDLIAPLQAVIVFCFVFPLGREDLLPSSLRVEAGIGGRESRGRASDYGEVKVGCNLSFLTGLATGFLSGTLAPHTGMLEVPDRWAPQWRRGQGGSYKPGCSGQIV